MTQSDNSKPKGQKNKKQLLIRYGKMGYMGWFDHEMSQVPNDKTRVVIKTARGLELGDVVGPCCYKGGQFKSSCKQVDDYYGVKGKDDPIGPGGTFVRYAREADLMEEKHLIESAKEELSCCKKLVKEMKLDMVPIESEHLLGGERVVIYFTSNGRIDFRDLVKRLAREFQTRIELRQIGSRDEAKVISDYETCGQQCCCSRFLKVLAPVNMRMAKLQKATLDPSKISGHCGRLKCCLRYEDQTYKELKSKLPKKNTMVKTAKGIGKIIDTQILTQLIVVQDQTGSRDAFGIDDVEILDEQALKEALQAQAEKAKAQPAPRKPRPPRQGGPEKKRTSESAQPAKKTEQKPAPYEQKQQGDATGEAKDESQEKPPARRRSRGRNRRRRGNRKPDAAGSDNNNNAAGKDNTSAAKENNNSSDNKDS